MFILSRLALILSSALVAAPAAAQLVPGETPTEDQVTSGEVLAAEPAPPAVEAVPVIALQPMPVAEWGREDVEEVLAYVERVGEGGLDHAEYQERQIGGQGKSVAGG